jgi:phosphotriesterase-related protein
MKVLNTREGIYEEPFSRRRFLSQAILALGSLAAFSGCSSPKVGRVHGQVMTALGPIDPDQMGTTLSHEHVLVDFIGAAKVSRDRYNPDEAFATALPHVQRVQALGCQTLVECTPAYLGRDPVLLQRLALATKLHILTNTGYYGAAQNKFLPAHALTDTADQLAARWFHDWREGIEETGVRPGFIKIGVDAGTLSELHRKLVRAAARTHLATGLTIAAHTGNGAAALDELATLREERVAGSAFIWVHAQNESNPDTHVRAAEGGAWVEFDGISPQSIARHVELVKNMKARGLLKRVLLSQDAGWYHVGEPGGGNFRPYDTLFTEFVPALRREGFRELEIRQMLVENPREAFTIRVRQS